MLAGLEEVDEGGVLIGGRDVTSSRRRTRDVAMVFENYALYPYLSVAANIGFPLKVAKVARRSATGGWPRWQRCSALTESSSASPAALGGHASGSRWFRAILRTRAST